jgi:hypothetical protein
MSNSEELLPFVRTGGIMATIPNWDDIPKDSHRTIRDYYPKSAPGSDYSLTLVMRPDPDNPNEQILQYSEPFGKSWKKEVKKFLSEFEFVYDENPKHRYLYARNTDTNKLNKPGPEDNWEIVRFRISLLPGGQLSVWTYWEREKDEADPDNFRAGYIWPPC